MFDAIAVSDFHLGSDICLTSSLNDFLHEIKNGNLKTNYLILNGDIFDSIDFRRLKKSHWKILSVIRSLSDQIKIIWVAGNHDGPAEIVSHLIGVEVVEEFVLESGQSKILFVHGHQFDHFIDKRPIITCLADWFYYFLQKLDKSHYFANLAKHSSKTFNRCVDRIQKGSAYLAKKRNCNIVCCGHTHSAYFKQLNDILSCNDGCWTSRPCTYLTISNGLVELNTYIS